MNYFQLLILLPITMLLSSCGEGELFGPKAPPLPGTRLNVLHYDLLKEKTLTKEEITIPPQTELTSWSTSDVGQFTGIPANIKLSNKLTFVKNINTQNNSNDNYSNVSGMPIAISNDVIYSYSNGVLSAYKIAFNKVMWSAKAIKGKAKDDIIGGAIAHTDDVVYLSSGERDFIAFNAHNGKELWRYTAPNVVRYIPTIYNGFIYLSSTDNTLLCLDLDGNLIWRYDAPIYSLITSRIYNPNIIYQDKIINITTAGDLIVLNRHDGTELFQVNLAITSVIGDGSLAKGPIASPILVGDYLYILTGESDLIKIDLANPQILWRQNFPSTISMWIADNVTYLITDSNQLMSVDNKNGQLIWVIDLNKELHKKDNTLFYGPVLAGDQLIMTAFEGDIFFLSAKDGKELSHFKNRNYTNQIPIIADEKAYFIGQNGIISVWK
jgi:outer membrane protein assembly factor BamB